MIRLSYQGLREEHLKHHAFTEVIWMEVSLLDEVQGADIGDERLNRRLGRVVEELGANPNLSITAATNARAEMEGAYRFFANDKVSPQKILGPHSKATGLKRSVRRPVSIDVRWMLVLELRKSRQKHPNVKSHGKRESRKQKSEQPR